MSSIFGDSLKSINEVTSYHKNTSESLHTANLIAVHNSPNLRAYLDDAEGIALEKTILQRLGLKDA